MNDGLSKKYFALLLLISLFSWSCRGTGSLTDGSGSGTTAAAAIVVPPPAKSLTPLPARELSREGREMRVRAMAAAAKLRGLDFTGGVGMIELTGWEYGTRSREMAELIGGDDLRSLTKLAVAGGMLPPGTDLATLASG
ncbi:MAG TPA: hypothetical protein VM870_06265, partial [Pyrinomonadaceae bacterium]|nr:hypothetical protein [Pyrinomonadaceae bacterium]